MSARAMSGSDVSTSNKMTTPVSLSAACARPNALRRCGYFVGRTENWLYDHLRCISRYRSVVLCDRLIDCEEFPRLEARCWGLDELPSRVWTRLWPARLHPPDARWLRRMSPACCIHTSAGWQ